MSSDWLLTIAVGSLAVIWALRCWHCRVAEPVADERHAERQQHDSDVIAEDAASKARQLEAYARTRGEPERPSDTALRVIRNRLRSQGDGEAMV